MDYKANYEYSKANGFLIEGKIDPKLPVYDAPRFKYIRIKDLKDGYMKLEFERWMGGQTQPLLWSEEEGDIQDAVFVWDYERFLIHLNGGSVLLD